MRTVVILLSLFAVLALSVWFAIYAWTAVGDVEMSGHGYAALVLGIVFSILIGCGLMALVFYSHRHGYDESPKVDE